MNKFLKISLFFLAFVFFISLAQIIEACGITDPTVTLSPSSQIGKPGDTLSYTFSIQDIDTPPPGCIYTVESSCPSDWICNPNITNFVLSAGETHTFDLLVTSPVTASSQLYTVSTVVSFNRAATIIKIKREATYAMLVAMKTRTDGKFYVPVFGPTGLNVVLLFDNPDLEGDQFGASGEYPIMPNGRVDIEDLWFVNNKFGKEEGDPGWEYMADVDSSKRIDMLDNFIVSKNFGNIGSYIYDPIGVTIGFDSGGELAVNPVTGTCGIPAGATSFTVKKTGVPIGAYILFYSAADCCPHITYTCPATVKVGENFQCTQTYTHDKGSQGGVNFNWLSDMADISAPMIGCPPGSEAEGCLDINGNTCTCGDPGCYKAVECELVNSGDTVTITLKAKKNGNLNIYHRAWDWSYDAVCPWSEVDRDPVSGTCSTNCDQFPNTDTIVCNKYTTSISVEATWPHITITPPATNPIVGQEFSVSLKYTHDTNETGGIHLRWLDDRFNMTDSAGCTLTTNPPEAPGWEGMECGAVNSGTTKTFKLKALVSGAQPLYYRAWDWSQDYVCGVGGKDYNRDPSSGSCSPNCDSFPDDWEICDYYSKSITVTALPVCGACDGNCPAGCTGVNDPDCPGSCFDCTCTTDTDCSNTCAAGDGCCSGCTPSDPDCFLTNPLACNTFSECVEKIIGFVLWVATAIVPIMIIVAGFLFLTSGGDPEKVRTAKRIIFWTVIGLAIILLAKGIISVIKQIIGG